MLFQSSRYDNWLVDLLENPIWGYMRGVNLAAWIIAITIMYVIGVIFLKRAYIIKDEPKKQLFRSFGMFFILMGITRISYILAYWIEPYYNFFLSLGYCFGALSLFPLVITLERWTFTKNKFFFTIVGAILIGCSFVFLILTFIIPSISEILRLILNIGIPIIAVSLAILYGIMIKNESGEIRRKTVFLLLGIIIFIEGMLLDSEMFLKVNASSMHIAPFVFILGMILIVLNQKIEKEDLDLPKK
jgi:FtsH-binding integral membrane protein